MHKYLSATAAIALVLGLATAAQADSDKVTICHATSSPTNPYVRIVVDAHAKNGHFNPDDRQPLHGHEGDLILDGTQPCPGDEPTEPPTTEPTEPTTPPTTEPTEPTLSEPTPTEPSTEPTTPTDGPTEPTGEPSTPTPEPTPTEPPASPQKPDNGDGLPPVPPGGSITHDSNQHRTITTVRDRHGRVIGRKVIRHDSPIEEGL